ncbi:MAG: hypothetical protein RIQ89_615 [Bacteroidota bacterium]|jgi:hypothetical protein
MELIDLDESYCGKVVQFLNQELPNIANHNEILRWQLRNPLAPPIYKIALDKGKVVAQYLLWPVLYSCNGVSVQGSLSVNTITARSHRGKGLFIQLAKEAYNDCLKKKLLFTIGFPNKNSIHGFVNRLNFKIIDSLNYFNFINFTSLNKLGLKYSTHFHGPEFVPSLPVVKCCEILPAASFSFDTMVKLGAFDHFPTTDWFDWRYKQFPSRNYYVFQSDSIIAVLRFKYHYGLPICWVVKLWTKHDRELGNQDLLGINSIAKASGSLLTLTILSEKNGFAHLENSFIKNQLLNRIKPVPIIYKCHFEQVNISSAHLMLGNYDVI